DLAVSGLLVLWFEWGVWLDLYGFTSRHPKSALDYFQGFVVAGSMLFAGLFAVFSVILLFTFYGDERPDSRHPLRTFYGGGSALVGKYAALVLSVVISPAFYF